MLTLPSSLWLLCFLSLPSLTTTSRPRPSILKRRNPSYSALSEDSLSSLASLTDLDTHLDFNNPTSSLSKLLIPRAAGSQNLSSLQSFSEQHFKSLGWQVERDAFNALTPVGDRHFENLIFTHDPSANRRIVLAAHLDSKFFPTHPEDQFVGATDSAAPCAILLDVASALTPWLDERKKRVVEEQGGEEGEETQGETLQIIFFDGEEAFKDWTHEDSIYGAKHLVEQWKKPTTGPRANKKIPSTPLARISHLVLLDLLGAPSPYVRSYYSSTGWLFDEFLHSETKLAEGGFLWEGINDSASYAKVKNQFGAKEKSFFVPRQGGVSFGGAIEDDHLPFLHNGVPVVHLITMPFPRVWHTIKDDATALDLQTIKAWALIVRLTIAEYLGLDPSLATTKDRTKRRRTEDDLTLAGD